LRTKMTPAAVNLWMLVDTSRVCAVQKFDLYLTSLPPQLKKQMVNDSRLSFVSFTGSTRDILAESAPLDRAESLKVGCESKYLSGSYEESLLRLIDSSYNDKYP